MIIVTVAGKVKPQFKQTFLDHMAELSAIVRQEQGCISYQQNISADEPLTLFLYEQWQSQALLNAHLASSHMQQHLEQARPWFDWVEMKTFEAQEFDLMESNHE